MKFKLSSAGSIYDLGQTTKLEGLGFIFKEGYDQLQRKTVLHKIDKEIEIEIETLDQLINFIKEHGTVIIDEDDIVIYDDCNEG